MIFEPIPSFEKVRRTRKELKQEIKSLRYYLDRENAKHANTRAALEAAESRAAQAERFIKAKRLEFSFGTFKTDEAVADSIDARAELKGYQSLTLRQVEGFASNGPSVTRLAKWLSK